MLGQTQFVGSKFRIFGGSGGFIVRFRYMNLGSNLAFSGFGPGFSLFRAKQVQRLGFLEEFEIQSWWMNLGSSEFEI